MLFVQGYLQISILVFANLLDLKTETYGDLLNAALVIILLAVILVLPFYMYALLATNNDELGL